MINYAYARISTLKKKAGTVQLNDKLKLKYKHVHYYAEYNFITDKVVQ